MNFTLKDVLLSAKKNPVISIEAHEPLGRALHLFQEHSISSLAVYGAPGSYYSSADMTLSIHNGKQYIGLLSLADCVSFLLTEGKDVEMSVLQAIGATNESMSLWILKTSDSLFSSLEPLGKGLHSFLVATPNEPLYLLSQQDILLFLHEQLLDDNFYDRYPMDLKSFCKSQLVVAKLDDSVQDVLKTMTTLAFRSVGVVDKFGSLVDYFSFSDLKALLDWTVQEHMLNAISLLKFTSVEKFIITCRGGISRKPGVYVLKTTALRDAIEAALEGHVHHVWIVNDISKHDRKPIGLVSLTDLIRMIQELKTQSVEML